MDGRVKSLCRNQKAGEEEVTDGTEAGRRAREIELVTNLRREQALESNWHFNP